MRISHRHKFIFFSNPRTGSTSLRDFLDDYSDFKGALKPTSPLLPFHDHMRPVDARHSFRQINLDYDRYYKFTVVRNPWARLASLYALIRKMRPDFVLPFILWLETVKPYGPGGGGNGDILQTWRQYGTYSLAAFAGDGTGNLLVDDVYRLEDIDRVPDELRRRGIPIPADAQIRHKNRTSGSINYRDLYTTKRSIDIVARLYEEDIKRFGYRFPESNLSGAQSGLARSA